MYRDERDSHFYDCYRLLNTPGNVTNPLLQKFRLYIDFHYTVECFKVTLQNHRCSLPTGGARCCFAQRPHRHLTAHETTVAQSDTVHKNDPLLIYLLVIPNRFEPKHSLVYVKRTNGKPNSFYISNWQAHKNTRCGRNWCLTMWAQGISQIVWQNWSTARNRIFVPL